MNQSSASRTNDFGSLTGSYPRATKSGVVFTILPIICLLAGLFTIIRSIVTWQLGTIVLGSIVGLAAFAIAAYLGLTAMREKDLMVQTFTDGLVLTRNKKSTSARWSEVISVLEDITRVNTGAAAAVTRQYALETQDGGKIKFDHKLANIEQLGETVQTEVFRHQFPRALERYNSGETVEFGKIGVSKQGISFRGNAAPWSEINGLIVKQGVIYLDRTTDKNFSAALGGVGKTPNFPVLLALVDYAKGKR